MELRHETTMVFHNVEYVLSLEVESEGDSLTMEVEDKASGSRWNGHFSSRYIEEITHKTGNFKKFSVFLKMLVTSMSPQGSDTVFIDLLTYNDLEMLKNRKARKQPGGAVNAKPNNKRYLILTYAVEFDRVHYPLPLQFVDIPDTDGLLKTIDRLRAELDAAQRGQAIQAPAAGVSDDMLHAELDEAAQKIEELEAVVRRLEAENNQLMNQQEVVHEAGSTQRLKKKLQDLEEELALQKKSSAKKTKQIEAVSEELEKARQAERRFRQKCRELTSEVQQHQRRRISPNTRGPPEPSSRRATPPGSRPSSRERGSGFVAPRPSSAPNSRGAPRFDPTAYQRDKEKRTRDRLSRIASEKERIRDSTSRPGSAERSRPGSRNNSRPNSAERTRSRPNSRPSSAERRSSTERQRGPSPNTSGGRRGPSPTGSAGSGAGRRRASPTTDTGRGRAPVKRRESPSDRTSRERPKSGGRKPKANKDVARDRTNSTEQRSRGKQDEGAAPSDIEISDIDARLNALQDFLKTAKKY